MEQYNNQYGQYNNPVVIEQKEPIPVGLQIAALITGIVGFIVAFIGYFAVIFGNVMRAAFTYSQTSDHGVGGILIALIVVALIVCVVALILGIVGLVRSIRRPRTVKGIVLSAIGLSFSCGGLALSVIGLFLNGFLSIIMNQIH